MGLILDPWTGGLQQEPRQVASPPVQPVRPPRIVVQGPAKVPPAQQQGLPVGQLSPAELANMAQGLGPPPAVAPVQVPRVAIQGPAPAEPHTMTIFNGPNVTRAAFDLSGQAGAQSVQSGQGGPTEWQRELATQANAPAVVLNGTHLTTRNFDPLGYTVEQRNLDPISIARQMAMANGGWGDWREHLGQARGVSELLMQQALSQRMADHDHSIKQRQLALDERARLGELDLNRQRTALEGIEKTMPHTAEGRMEALVTRWVAEGVPPAEIRRRVDDMRAKGVFQTPALVDDYLRQYQSGPAGGMAGGGGAGGNGGDTKQPPPPTTPINPWSAIEGQLDEQAMAPSSDGKPPGQRRPIGEFLWLLDKKYPGIVATNKDAIVAYLKHHWGDSSFNQALLPPVGVNGPEWIPFASTVPAAINLATDPQARQSWLNWAKLIPLVGPAAASIMGEKRLMSQHTDDELGRSALRKLLGDQ